MNSRQKEALFSMAVQLIVYVRHDIFLLYPVHNMNKFGLQPAKR